MNYKIDRVEALTLGTQPVTVKVGGLSCLVQNRSESAVVYFKEKREDGVEATASNGYALGPGRETVIPLAARELSMVSGAAGTDVRVLILDVE